ncbi:SDR family oxidoreductase [Lactococcus paracarnosus]|uniref:SDR family oxidoreductase n=1 Tax=Pseudolactococcus paracarnosus TaxID=2749962 RepID=A0ABT0AK30_9LACT|nr:SDR family oxidoreductase [Lactococcus paracarnosus]MCJ1976838.1 SDR family oxidoreductase [Lactococcus paracarnosus]MCJ1982776.1 SDR family oxidoreductase [Lactococcus paracarnosus]MCJ1998043.1 SDR family oxidoreductase [Lactococcus paracarnosus]
MKKLIVITGAGSGFGKKMAKTFSEMGHPLLLIGRNKTALDQLGLANTMTRSVDVGNQAAFNEAILAAELVYGDVDLLINNAGQMLLGDVGNQAAAEWERMINVNLFGTLNGIQAVLPAMTERKSGTIINVSSIAGFKAFENHAAYCATKFGIHGLTETVRLEASKNNVRILLISPGAAETPLLGHTTRDDIKDGYHAWKQTMGGVSMDPKAVANAVAFMYAMPQEVSIRELVIASTLQDN